MRRRVRTYKRHLCDLCGKAIMPGDRCYLVEDDFMPGLRVYEHLSCCNPGKGRQGRHGRPRKQENDL